MPCRHTPAAVKDHEKRATMEKCIRASAKGQLSPVREAFELFFELLRRLDRDPDSVVFFADKLP